MKGYNCYHTFDNGQRVYLVGQLARGIPFLATSKGGAFVTPFLIDNGGGEMSMVNESNAYAYCNGKMAKVSIAEAKSNLTMKDFRIPSVVVNDDSGAKFYPFVAFGDDAIRVHRMDKGDTVVVIARNVVINIPGIRVPKEMLWVEDIRLIRRSQNNLRKEAITI